MTHSRLTSLLTKNNVLFEKQFGFGQNCCTTHALIAITEKIKQACDIGHYPCGVFLDLEKAFDTVNHIIHFKKTSPLQV